MNRKIKIILLILFVLAISAVGYGYSVYKDIFKSNITENTYLFIPTNSTFESLIDSLSSSGVVGDIGSFKKTATLKKYGEKIYPGRYKIEKGMTNNHLVNMLRSGRQSPVKFTFNNVRTIHELASKVSGFIEADSLSLVELISSEKFTEKHGFDQRNIISMFIPNTYEFYWNTNAVEFFDKMLKEYETFWTEERIKKAEKLNLSPQEVSILASIVQAEQSAYNDEKPIVAGLYINRLDRNMALQSDPTLIFASGDYTKKRVLNRDKEIESPYNTYKYPGLTPGPINMPEISSIDAVLNFTKHNYIFMCAKEDFSGYHNFSTNVRQHEIYAQKYRQALNKRKIWK